ncbi:phosphoribosyl-ATP diphosphatase [Botrimarina hoheduenensis]|uniref:Phosphoribosyl-ATP pyrophosphatase n=1 Tax=Botrimarina hoheduenensis TaxID=2528000 RepID=A0A5C5WET4_9BACT|nr:phosphoribosyl-ATP diphosphatase [Botrimarina hoheduenensis]TWT48613.1 Phosphoribosyl-ATP pyrophosphatase [Botrimarina hoheduenensis]
MHDNPSPAAPRPLDQLERTIGDRAAQAEQSSSYTAKLLAAGVAKIGAKVTEEAAELVEAAAEPGTEGRTHFIYEAGDLLYHTLVLLRWRGVELAEVEAELARRFGVSGITEKESRAKHGS